MSFYESQLPQDAPSAGPEASAYAQTVAGPAMACQKTPNAVLHRLRQFGTRIGKVFVGQKESRSRRFGRALSGGHALR